jgi:acetolactate decarboxylase
MVRRRDLLKASLSVCGCATCGALGLGVSGGSARADGPTAISGKGYQLWFIGAQRETIMNGKLAAALDLKTLAGRIHLYGLGPIEQLRGEVTIADSRPALAHVAPDGTINVTDSFDAGVPFFVWAEVPHWVKMPIPERVRSFEDLERFVPRAAEAAGLDAEKPLPFLVTGRENLIEYHILNRIGDPPHNMEAHKKIQIVFELTRAEATIVGFHSTKHRGIFAPGDSNIHIHFQTPDNDKSGHIQKIEVGSGATLSLPAAETAASSIEPLARAG